MKYFVLLRGINISGKNKISMEELKKYLIENEYQSVFQGNEYSVKGFNFSVRPVLYLDAGNINIVGGDGLSSNQYRIN